MKPPLICLIDISLTLPKISPKFFQLFFAIDLTIFTVSIDIFSLGVYNKEKLKYYVSVAQLDRAHAS